MFLFYVGNKAGYSLPKRVVDQADLGPLRQLVQDRLPILDRRRGRGA